VNNHSLWRGQTKNRYLVVVFVVVVFVAVVVVIVVIVVEIWQ